jgi:SAM-dependent methyltransferase
MNIDAASLVRLVPEAVEPGDTTGQESLKLHEERYRFAARCARPGRLLDIACGVGYGTRLVVDESDVPFTALGVDLSEEAIAYASEHYAQPGTSFLAADAMSFRDSDGFDTIVSLETIEHLPQPDRFVDGIVTLLKPGGSLVVSVPSAPTKDVNPHHLHDFTESSFRRLFARYDLTEVGVLRQMQPVALLSVIRRNETRMGDMRPNLPLHYLRHPGALMTRIGATLRYGFSNRYLTIAWQRAA